MDRFSSSRELTDPPAVDAQAAPPPSDLQRRAIATADALRREGMVGASETMTELVRLLSYERAVAAELLKAVRPLDIPWLDHGVLSDELRIRLAASGTNFEAFPTVGQLRAIRAAIAKAEGQR